LNFDTSSISFTFECFWTIIILDDYYFYIYDTTLTIYFISVTFGWTLLQYRVGMPSTEEHDPSAGEGGELDHDGDGSQQEHGGEGQGEERRCRER
jgi:hypothetical protein